MNGKNMNYRIINNHKFNQYQFYCERSNMLVYTTSKIKANTQIEEYEYAWNEAKVYFNYCRKCGKWVCTEMFNPDICLCVDCAPFEEEPNYCAECGTEVIKDEKFCSKCGSLLRYKGVYEYEE